MKLNLGVKIGIFSGVIIGVTTGVLFFLLWSDSSISSLFLFILLSVFVSTIILTLGGWLVEVLAHKFL